VVGRNGRLNFINPDLVATPDWKKTARQLTGGTEGTWEQYLDVIDKNLSIVV